MADTTVDHDLEFVFEYTTINSRRRRVTIIPDTGGEAWRIGHEYRDGEWRETGREPISDIHLQLSSFGDSDTSDTDPDAGGGMPGPTKGSPDSTSTTVQGTDPDRLEAGPSHGDHNA